MRKVIEPGAFVFLIIGTLGLLINELAFDWGRAATLAFAAVNFVGLVTLGLTHCCGMKQDI